MTLANGALDGALLLSAAGSSGARLRFGTASRWAKIRNEVHALYGWWPEVTSAGDGYRSLARQVELFRRNYTTSNTGHGPVKRYEGSLWWRKTAGTPSAATPGTSNHGLGTTVDVINMGGLNNFTATRYRQFADVAGRHGFTNAEGRSIGEPWHWSDTKDPDVAIEFVERPASTPAPEDAPPAELEEPPMFKLYIITNDDPAYAGNRVFLGGPGTWNQVTNGNALEILRGVYGVEIPVTIQEAQTLGNTFVPGSGQ